MSGMRESTNPGPAAAALAGALLSLFAAAGAAQTLPERQLLKLLAVRTICVEELGGRDAGPIRDMLIGALQRTGLFILSEDEDEADAFLRGSAEDLIYSDYSNERSGLNVRGSASRSEREQGESSFDSASFGVGETEANSRRERRHEAVAAVRLTLPDGEVIWSTTRESLGAKFHGSSVDVAEKVAKDLADAYRLARKLAEKRQAKPAP